MKKLFVLCLALTSWSALAYHLDDHEAVTHEAFQELIQCFPKAAAMLNVEWMVQGDLDEDTNLFNKWLFYSHYYNPNKKLDMRRADSSERVGALSSTLHQPATDSVDYSEMSDLGHMIHHFQDATVPAHVTPVDHSMWDGFETYKVGSTSSGYTCAQIASLGGDDPLVILKETALTTLSNIQNWQYGVGFWQESDDDQFGVYGALGNNFGQTSFRQGGRDYQIDAETYQTFKQRQMQLAVRATIRGLMWELGDHLKNLQMECEPTTTALND